MKNWIIALPLLMVFLLSFVNRPLQELWKAPSSADSLYNPYNIEPLTLPQGQEVYAIYCAPCHGKTGKADGPEFQKLDVKPLPFQSAQSKNQSDGALYWKISTGRGEMPGFRDVLSDEQKWQLVEYVRDLAKPFEEQHNPFKVDQ